ncbi:methyltransferase domain-containing protein [Temperatibacter marinus]|uniref:Methyltransferase domain-containing protein n=1 Tax=Temperatibacter marinus TaxID=1456591 RepID=A0AA52EE29_9PROT|nr:methyltransferase domain-containing protein [Temperatibacter marinus]WND01368.1 methyltransferase domain-containing protein [Temperatibacter marinus]
MNKMTIFDRDLLKARRVKALQQQDQFDFLHREVADRLSERVEEVKRDFETPLQMGLLGGLLPCLRNHSNLTRADRVAIDTDLVLSLDEEFLDLDEKGYDLFVSHMLLHWVNDLPGALVQMNRVLKPDGLFLASLIGGESLKELRDCLLRAETEISGGVSPRVSPFVDVRDAGSLLQRAGFALPVTDLDTITIEYENPLKLMQDLKGMGESNAILERRKGATPPRILMRAAEIYLERYRLPNGRIPATFQIIYLTGWAPHESQQQPLKPGSAKMSLADALNSQEKKF